MSPKNSMRSCPVFRVFQTGFYKCLNSNKFSFKNLRFWVSRAIFASCLYVGRSTSRAAPASRWWTRAVGDTVSCAALVQRARNGRSGVLRPRGDNMSRNTATPSFPFSAKALTTGLRSWSLDWATFYEMTTLYFEASDEDDLRKCGFSKDGKHGNPQIFLGLLVAAGGNPIGYDIYEGNIFEGHTLMEFIGRMSAKFGFGKPIVVADAGLLSKRNIAGLKEEGYEFIVGARPRNDSEAVKKAILGLGLKDGDVRVIDRPDGTRMVVSKTESRTAKDKKTRQRGLDRLEKRLGSGRLTKASINNKGYNKYLKMEGDVKISIDYDRFGADEAWDGIKGYVTNTSLSNEEVIDRYSDLWRIERAFRMNKTDLQVRPIFHRLRNRIEGHICICFTAYTIMLELDRLLKASKSAITLARAQQITRSMYQLTYVLPQSGYTKTTLLRMDEEQQELYDIVTYRHKC